MFILWFSRAKSSMDKLGCLQIDSGGKFMSSILKNYCNKRGINIWYTTSYIHKENNIAKQYWKTLLTMIDYLLIDSNLSVNFWAKAMDITNYLQNQLLTIQANISVIVLEKTWTTARQNVEYIRIFGSKASTHIPTEKSSKSQIYKLWNKIFIGYTNTTKHVRV